MEGTPCAITINQQAFVQNNLAAAEFQDMQQTLNRYQDELARFWPGPVSWDCPMSRYSTLRVGGPAEALVMVENLDGLTSLLGWLHARRIPWHVIGRGSNILVPDQGLAGVVVILAGAFETIEAITPDETPTDDSARVRAGAACSLARLVQHCIDNGLSGLEFCTGIPGTLGGAIVMNAGAWGGAIGDLVQKVAVVRADGTPEELSAAAIPFAYRTWGVATGLVVTGATLQLHTDSMTAIEARCRSYQEQRRSKQPLNAASAGSFFKNPPQQAAGRLIEQTGLKGYKIGGAMISDKHANFIITTDAATADDVLTLMRYVQDRVHEATGIRLEPEVRILGSLGAEPGGTVR